jgi:hypothetical protein
MLQLASNRVYLYCSPAFMEANPNQALSSPRSNQDVARGLGSKPGPAATTMSMTPLEHANHIDFHTDSKVARNNHLR